MLRFRNPGTQYSTQIQVIKQLYNALGGQKYFTLDDMAIVIAKGNLMTAYGYSGESALELSNTDLESMNSAKMNAKMYAEVFRMLGWVTPFNEKKSYPLVFTYLGIHIALSELDCLPLYEQCVIGINNPTQLVDRISYQERVRFFKCALRTFIELGGTMYKHELCLGPMSVDDQDEKAYQAMIEKIKSIRGDYSNLKKAFSQLANSLNMKETPVDNSTRMPIALMKSCGWIINTKNSELYNKSLSCLKITQHGINMYHSLQKMYDLRLDEYVLYPRDVQEAMIRIGMYSMLIRAGYDLSAVHYQFEKDKKKCDYILKGKELLFSPCQTIRRSTVEQALGVSLGGKKESTKKVTTFESAVDEREALYVTRKWDLNIPEDATMDLLKDEDDRLFLERVEELKQKGYNSSKIVDKLFIHYISATQTTFYPLIATLFKIMGFNCSYSRPGDNGARWDAIIDDPKRSIPIEIKSPTEEEHISMKALRQALENKIILLSRETHKTSPEVTTLVVGYYMPNERAEVNRMLSDFKQTYGYSIGIIDLKSLLSLSISILVDGKGFDREELYHLEGMMNASI